eukprot:scaffold69924_cov48-Phaeocystis_antarctica.AAC.1
MCTCIQPGCTRLQAAASLAMRGGGTFGSCESSSAKLRWRSTIGSAMTPEAAAASSPPPLGCTTWRGLNPEEARSRSTASCPATTCASPPSPPTPPPGPSTAAVTAASSVALTPSSPLPPLPPPRSSAIPGTIESDATSQKVEATPGATTSSTTSCASEHCLARVSSSGPSGRVSRSSAAACVAASSADAGGSGISRVRLPGPAVAPEPLSTTSVPGAPSSSAIAVWTAAGSAAPLAASSTSSSSAAPAPPPPRRAAACAAAPLPSAAAACISGRRASSAASGATLCVKLSKLAAAATGVGMSLLTGSTTDSGGAVPRSRHTATLWSKVSSATRAYEPEAAARGSAAAAAAQAAASAPEATASAETSSARTSVRPAWAEDAEYSSALAEGWGGVRRRGVRRRG